jgi:hypothetical protein
VKFSLSFEASGSDSLGKRSPRMKPTFDQVLRLIVCVAGIVFFGVGIWMVKTGISANGVIDIKSEVLSGHLETGSAGLFFAFFSFFMIVLPFVVGRHQARLQHTIGQPKRPKHKKTNRSISSAAILLSLVFSYSAMGQTNSPYALTSYLGDERTMVTIAVPGASGYSKMVNQSVILFAGHATS